MADPGNTISQSRLRACAAFLAFMGFGAMFAEFMTHGWWGALSISPLTLTFVWIAITGRDCEGLSK